MVAAMKLSKMNRLGCTSHSLHRLIVHDILQNPTFNVFLNTVIKLKRIYKCLNYNTENILKIQHTFEDECLLNILDEATEIFSKVEIENQYIVGEADLIDEENIFFNKSLGTLKNSNATRWNTLCTMFQSFYKNQKVINVALIEIERTDLAINHMEKQLLEEFLTFLKIFEDATKYFLGRKYPTINTNIVFFEKIQNTLEENVKTASFGQTLQMYQYAIEHFQKRFKIYKIHLVAALLDPLQKNWKCLEKWLRKVPKNNIMGFFEELNNDDPEGGVSKMNIILDEITKNSYECTTTLVDAVATTSKSTKKQVICIVKKIMEIFMIYLYFSCF